MVDGAPYCTGAAEFDGGGTASFGCSQPWHAEAGTHVVQWVLDPNDTIREADEANNAPAQLVTVTAPAGIDFQPLRAYLRDAPVGSGHEIAHPQCGESVYVHFDYQLLGTAETVWEQALASIDGAPFCAGTLPAPGGMPTYVYCTNPWVAAPGRHTIRLDLDVATALAETNEDNNAIELTFDVA